VQSLFSATSSPKPIAPARNFNLRNRLASSVPAVINYSLAGYIQNLLLWGRRGFFVYR
jgi:hypothetical protein